MKNLSTFLNEGKKAIGYKVMRYEDGKIISGANSRISFKLKKGMSMGMGGNGIYLSNSKQHVLDYYSGLADQEVLLYLEYDVSQVTNPLQSFDTDQELQVPKAKVIDFEILSIDS